MRMLRKFAIRWCKTIKFNTTMGDWASLHLFDTTKYIKEVIPVVRNLESYLPTFLNDERRSWLDGFSNPVDKNLSETIKNETIKFVLELNEELKAHPKLSNLKQVANKNYDNYFSHLEDFYRRNQHAKEFFGYIMIQTIFSNTSNFYPYFTFGKRLFEAYIRTENNSIAETLTSKIRYSEEDIVLSMADSGIINWLSSENVELLYLDKDNILPLNDEDEEHINYTAQFKKFLKIAFERKLGVISLRNSMESEFSRLPNSLNDIVVTFDKTSKVKYIFNRQQLVNK